jgi:hypothetical protein
MGPVNVTTTNNQDGSVDINLYGGIFGRRSGAWSVGGNFLPGATTNTVGWLEAEVEQWIATRVSRRGRHAKRSSAWLGISVRLRSERVFGFPIGVRHHSHRPFGFTRNPQARKAKTVREAALVA